MNIIDRIHAWLTRGTVCKEAPIVRKCSSCTHPYAVHYGNALKSRCHYKECECEDFQRAR